MTTTHLHSDGQLSLGRWLRNARLDQGLDTALAARRTRTRVAVIEALEADNYQALGAPVFIRMYLLRYGELLGLAEHEVLGRFKALGIDDPPPLRVAHPMNASSRSGDLRWLSYPAVFALIGWLGWTVTQQLPDLNDDNPLPPGFELTGINPDQLNVEPAPPPPVVVTPAELTGSTEAVSESNNETLHIALAVHAPAPLPPPTLRNNSLQALGAAQASEVAALLEQDSEPDPEPTDSPPNQHELILELTDDCWVEVEDAEGRRLVYALLSANERRTVQGPAPFSIRLGNAQAVTLTLNGESIDRAVYLPSRGSVSRFTLQAP